MHTASGSHEEIGSTLKQSGSSGALPHASERHRQNARQPRRHFSCETTASPPLREDRSARSGGVHERGACTSAARARARSTRRDDTRGRACGVSSPRRRERLACDRRPPRGLFLSPPRRHRAACPSGAGRPPRTFHGLRSSPLTDPASTSHRSRSPPFTDPRRPGVRYCGLSYVSGARPRAWPRRPPGSALFAPAPRGDIPSVACPSCSSSAATAGRAP